MNRRAGGALQCHAAAPSAAVADIEVEVSVASDGEVQAADAAGAAHARTTGAPADEAGADIVAVTLVYVVRGDLSRLCVPAPRPARRADGLWRHTCFEVFLQGLARHGGSARPAGEAGNAGPGEAAPEEPPGGAPRYLELNFSPSGEWAAYEFEAYRRGMVDAAAVAAPQIEVYSAARELSLCARVRGLRLGGARLPLGDAQPPLDGPRVPPGRPRLRLALAAVMEERDGGHAQAAAAHLSYWALRHPPGRPDFHHPDGFALEL